jgi:hypothetical protein
LVGVVVDENSHTAFVAGIEFDRRGGVWQRVLPAELICQTCENVRGLRALWAFHFFTSADPVQNQAGILLPHAGVAGRFRESRFEGLGCARQIAQRPPNVDLFTREREPALGVGDNRALERVELHRVGKSPIGFE